MLVPGTITVNVITVVPASPSVTVASLTETGDSRRGHVFVGAASPEW